MRTLSPVLLSLHIAAIAAAQDPGAARVERDAVVQHYAAVESELRQAPAPADAAVAARRSFVLDALRAYRERGDFGQNHAYDGSRVPLFVDADGRRCAVAWLLDRTGHGELTLAIQRRCNEAWIAELAGDRELQAWLTTHGLTAAEAARIQMPGSGWVTIEPPPQPDPSETPPKSLGTPGGPSTGGPVRPSAPSRSDERGPVTGSRRAMPLEVVQNASWLDWWEWNRGVFEPPLRAKAAPAPAATVAAPELTAVTSLLTTLASSTHSQVRAAAVQALGRIGVAPDQVGKHFDDNAREVRFASLLGLGAGGTAAHAHALATQASQPQQGEMLAVALAGIAAIDAGPAHRALDPTVNGLLTDRRNSVHTSAALAARHGHDDATVRAAARAAVDAATTPGELASAASLLGLRPEERDIATLTKLVNDRSVEVRRSAALALGRSKHALALPALQSAFELEHENETRSLQLLAIGDHGGDAAKAFLIKAMTDGSKQQRAHASLALGLWGCGREAGDVAERIASAFENERNRDHKGAYLIALGLLRHAGSRDLLTRELLEGSTSPTRGAAASALGLLGDPTVLASLQKAAGADSCPWVRQQVARAMTSLGGAAADALIATMRTDKHAGVQSAAAFALGGIADARAAAALLTFAADEQSPPAARAGAALGLGRHFRRNEPRLPELRFQHNHLLLPSVAAWAFSQEL